MKIAFIVEQTPTLHRSKFYYLSSISFEEVQ
jgi:hypothetical protein